MTAPAPESAADPEQLARAVALEPNSAAAHFALAMAWHRRNAFADAAAGYQKAIALAPDFAAAHCNLAMAYRSLGNLDESAASSRRAIELEPASHVAHNNLGLALQALGRPDDAAACYRRAIALRPEYAEAYSNLGAIAGDRNEYSEAAECFRKAVELRPDLPPLRYNLGCALFGLQRVDEATVQFAEALRLNPGYWEACSWLGFALHARGQLEPALAHCTRAVQLRPDAAEAHFRLGVVLKGLGRMDESIASLERAIALNPRLGEAFNELATAYQAIGQLEQAVAVCRRGIEALPGYPVTHCALGIALAELGLIEEALLALRRAIELKPDYEAAYSSYLFFLNYSSRHDPRAVLEEHRRWAQARANSLAPAAPNFENDRTPGRRLRIGYVSPDFRQHSVAFFLTPVLARHDHRGFEVFCYSDVQREDAVTRQMQGYADVWRNIVGLSDEQVAAQVREDRIDVLIDLALHSGCNRMLVFARKPAPVQVTWLGYAGTTGLATMDYKITDPHLDPIGKTESWHSEKLIRMPDYICCYQPPSGYPAVSEPPARVRGFVTFCAFQNLARVSPQAVELWSQVLEAVPRSQLMIKARGLGSEATRQRLISMFTARGISEVRLVLEDWGDMNEYLGRLGEVDIGLDTMPSNGGTTTCHALWMGVPVVTLAGESALGRMGASILQNLGLRELIADNPDDYVQITVRLASDLGRLNELRQGLRERMQHSPLADAGRFTGNLEAAFRAMWIRWCGGGQG